MAQTDPIARFGEWLKAASSHPQIKDATAMSLATATINGVPSVRIVLLKSFGADGFSFYTNLESRKSSEIRQNPRASLCFYWPPLLRQVRVDGIVQPVSAAEADEYYNSRPLVSRLGAIASRQSRPLDSRTTLMAKIKVLATEYTETNPPPRPDHWSGWRVVPQTIEFWQEGEFRLHDRELYRRAGEGWITERLYP